MRALRVTGVDMSTVRVYKAEASVVQIKIWIPDS